MDKAPFVIVGAGASHHAGSTWPPGCVRPPLVKELFDESDRWSGNPDLLIASLMRHFHHTCSVTLNYDLILDRALGKLDTLSTLDRYIGDGRWSLIKLHGLVNWGYPPLDRGISLANPPANLAEHLGKEITIGRDKLFPALTVPVGEEDEETCPSSHLAYLDRRLRAEDELDLLILGYSAYDRTVLERIASSERGGGSEPGAAARCRASSRATRRRSLDRRPVVACRRWIPDSPSWPASTARSPRPPRRRCR